MFSRLTNTVFRSANNFKLQTARRFISTHNNRLRTVGLTSLLGVTTIGLVSSNVLLSQPKDDEVAKGLVDLYMCLKAKYLANDDNEAAQNLKNKLELLQKNIEDMYVEDFKKSLAALLEKNNADDVVIPTTVKNTAFVFIKPHAVTDAVVDLVESTLKSKGINIVESGTILGEDIDKKMLIDQHYYSIASKATLLLPEKLNVPPAKFKNKFGLEWSDALAQGVVYNAKDACEFLGLDSSGLNAEWARCKNEGRMVKFGGGFYCGLINTVPNKPAVYVFNGFFMSMRNKFVSPGSQIKYFVVDWDGNKLSWEEFRGDLLGPTDPVTAPTESLRGLVYKDWESLGLSSIPNVGDNAVHASASPFEALAERLNWLGADVQSDSFGKLLLESGISEEVIKKWSVDPQVVYGSASLPIKMSLFDSLEDTDSDMCLARMMMIANGLD